MNHNIIDKDGFFIELGKLMRSTDPNESKEIVKTLVEFTGGEVPKDMSDEWVEHVKSGMIDRFLEYLNSLKAPKEENTNKEFSQ